MYFVPPYGKRQHHTIVDFLPPDGAFRDASLHEERLVGKAPPSTFLMAVAMSTLMLGQTRECKYEAV